ncbi:hypothetical protein [Rhabdothermincola sediminis]|uniref:hypothetical protein n=1 Tax=Rhabdothermincola sediminis TaxID=2751370 RepID=UPI001AA04BAF|nr:hypothetical protein [Rhabdothermincola sediminis]
MEHPTERPPDPRVLDGKLWDLLLDQLAGLRSLVWAEDVPADPVVRAEGLRYLLRFLAAGIAACIEYDDTETPELGRYIENRMSWGLDNPDCNYSYTRIRGGATYRVSGNRGTARHLELQVNTGHMADGDFAGWRTVSAMSGDELATDPDEDFELFLSPEEHTAGNWMRLDDTASFLLVRQYFDDWEHERPAELVIEQVGFPYPPAPLSTGAIGARVELLCQWLEVGARCWHAISRGILAGTPGDLTPFRPPAEASGLKGQAYGMGAWRCEPDEAVILTLDPPPCRMWGVSLCDRFWQSIDFANHQSSLNSAQASLTGRGRFVGVISHDDPGVANWLDPAGHREGTLALRYLLPEVGDLPTMRYHTVARHDLEGELPADTPRLDPAGRRAVIERRRRAVMRRYRR